VAGRISDQASAWEALHNYFQRLEELSAAFCDAEGGRRNPEMEGGNSWGAEVTAQENAVVHSAPFAAK
jgi:hypothetical protein